MPSRWVWLAALSACLHGQGVDMVFLLDASPGTEHAAGLIEARALADADRAAVASFRIAAQLIQPLTGDRKAIDKALRRAGVRGGAGIGRGSAPMSLPIDIAAAIRVACDAFGEPESPPRRRAIVLLFGNEDHAIAANTGSIRARLSGANARLYVIAVYRTSATGPVPGRLPGPQPSPFPALTARILGELAEDSGGRLFDRNWDLKDILADARKSSR